MNENDTTAKIQHLTLEDMIVDQARGGEFICRHCRHYIGGVTCGKFVFIGWKGADTSRCVFYAEERRGRKEG